MDVGRPGYGHFFWRRRLSGFLASKFRPFCEIIARVLDTRCGRLRWER